ncbi:hypothetical protein JXB28_01025 [Candidatus Woesearchaeota archaeon]|nr:hypothetical protein [Candidatus Woesearchaeota archaeon]
MAKPKGKTCQPPKGDIYQSSEFNHIKSSLGALKKEMFSNMPAIREEVEEIITLKDRNTARIEQTLDTLLDYMMMDIGEREFNMLNEYYKEIDKEGYDFYRKLYNEVKGED